MTEDKQMPDVIFTGAGRIGINGITVGVYCSVKGSGDPMPAYISIDHPVLLGLVEALRIIPSTGSQLGTVAEKHRVDALAAFEKMKKENG